MNSCYLVSTLDPHLVEPKLFSTAGETQVLNFASRIPTSVPFGFHKPENKGKTLQNQWVEKKSYCREPILLLVVNEKQIVRDTFLNNFHLQQKVFCQKKWPILFSEQHRAF